MGPGRHRLGYVAALMTLQMRDHDQINVMLPPAKVTQVPAVVAVSGKLRQDESGANDQENDQDQTGVELEPVILFSTRFSVSKDLSLSGRYQSGPYGSHSLVTI